MPRVLFVNRVYRPSEAATAQLLADLAEGLAARGWQVEVIAAGDGPAALAGVTIHRTGGTEGHAGLFAQAGNYLRFLHRARDLIGRLAAPGVPVVLMTDPPLLAAAATGPARRRGAPVIQWIQDIYPEIVPAHAGAWTAGPLAPLRGLRNRAWRRSAQCIPVGADMRATVLAAGAAPELVAVHPNWAPRELETVPPAAAVQAQREVWAVADRFVVAYSGNFGRVHEFATLLAAAERLRDDPGIVFLLIGAGPRRGAVQAEVERRGLPNVRFLPFQRRDALAAGLAAADVQAVTLRPGFEALVSPSKLAGVLAAGRPVLFVGAPGAAAARLVRESGAGVAVAPGDADALAAAVRRWRDDPAARAEAGRRARAAYAAQFSLAAALDAWEALLRAGVGAET